MNRSYKTINSAPQRTTRNTVAPTPDVVFPQQVIQPPVIMEQSPTPAPTQLQATPTPMVPEENVKIVKFKVKNKVSGKVKRQRANRRLRRLLSPKTAAMALHELFTEEQDNNQDLKIVVSENPEGPQKPGMGALYKAEAVYQGKVYQGLGKWFDNIVAT